MRDTLKKQKGITLTTLVITIIVLVILAAVSITYSTDSIDHSRYMTMLSEIQIIQEKINVYYSEGKEIVGTTVNVNQQQILQEKGVSPENYGDYYYFSNTALRQALDIDSIEGEYLISVKNRDVIGLSAIKKDGQEYINYRFNDIGNGYNVDYIGGQPTSSKLASKAKVGDLVKYDPTSGGNVTEENTTYTSQTGTASSHGNGSGNQTFSAQAYKNSEGKWQILDIDDDGIITLISEPIYQDSTDDDGNTVMGSTGFGIYMGVGYIYAEEELHRIAAVYGHGEGADTTQTITYYYGGPNDQETENTSITPGTVEAQQGRKTTIDLDSGARAITVNDIDKICGVDGTYTSNYYSTSVTKSQANAQFYPTINSSYSATAKSAAQSTFDGVYYWTSHSYNKISSANSDSVVQTSQNSVLNVGQDYWLASRGVSVADSYTYFNVGKVSYVGGNSSVGLDAISRCYSGEYSTMTVETNAVRVLVTLKSEVQTSDIEYDNETGWTIM